MNSAHLHSASCLTRSPDAQRLTRATRLGDLSAIVPTSKRVGTTEEALPPARLGIAPLRRDDGRTSASSVEPRSLVGETRRWTSPAARASRDALRSTLNAQRAFTLVELLVVIVVLAVLAGITLPLFRYTMTRINQSRQNIMLDQIKSALEDYRAAYGEYPITPPANPDDVRRHYPDNLATDQETIRNSPFINVAFGGTTTVEQCFSSGGAISISIDYSLTYPLMIKQLDKGANPFMEFPKVTVFYMVYRSSDQDKLEQTYADTKEVGRVREGGLRTITTPGGFHRFIYGNPVKRYKAVDPISGKQWKYECTNGLNYSLTLY